VIAAEISERQAADEGSGHDPAFLTAGAALVIETQMPGALPGIGRECERGSSRLARDVVGHDAGEKAAVFDLFETDSAQQLAELLRRVEMPDRVGEVAYAL